MQDEVTIKKRDSVILTFTFTDNNGTAINLTGGKVYLTVKTKESDADADAILTKDITTFSDPTNGITTMELSKTETDLTPGVYFYDVQFKDSSDRVRSSDTGKFIIKQDVTVRAT